MSKSSSQQSFSSNSEGDGSLQQPAASQSISTATSATVQGSEHGMDNLNSHGEVDILEHGTTPQTMATNNSSSTNVNVSLILQTTSKTVKADDKQLVTENSCSFESLSTSFYPISTASSAMTSKMNTSSSNISTYPETVPTPSFSTLLSLNDTNESPKDIGQETVGLQCENKEQVISEAFEFHSKALEIRKDESAESGEVEEFPENAVNSVALAYPAPESTAANSNESTEKTKPKTKSESNRCKVCRKKVGLTGIVCRCGGLFCPLHRYSDTHDCPFDYRQLGAEEIRKNNPVVVREKIQKL